MDDVIKLLEMRMGARRPRSPASPRPGAPAKIWPRCASGFETMRTSGDIDQAVAADMAFHRAIAAATRNDYYLRFMDFLGIRLVPPRRLFLRDREDTEHRALPARSIATMNRSCSPSAAQDASRARQAARRHEEEPGTAPRWSSGQHGGTFPKRLASPRARASPKAGTRRLRTSGCRNESGMTAAIPKLTRGLRLRHHHPRAVARQIHGPLLSCPRHVCHTNFQTCHHKSCDSC